MWCCYGWFLFWGFRYLFLCSLSCVNRDLKLENFLFSDEAADSELKMIDFGLSKVRNAIDCTILK